jgi:hypothetical protein
MQAKFGGPMPVTAEACNRCNDTQVLQTGYCCDFIDCHRICNRKGNPDLCNFARDPKDAFREDPTALPLMWDPTGYKEAVDDPKKWKKEPKTIKNAKRYGTFKPAIFLSEQMQKRLENKDE